MIIRLELVDYKNNFLGRTIAQVEVFPGDDIEALKDSLWAFRRPERPAQIVEVEEVGAVNG